MNKALDRLITLTLIALLGWGGWSVLHWLLVGADWAVVRSNLPLYAVGSYPEEQRWRPLLWMAGLIVLITLTLAGPRTGLWRKALPITWIAMAPVGLWLLAGGIGLLPVGTRDWGGLTLTLLLTTGSGLLALPMGVLLALGNAVAIWPYINVGALIGIITSPWMLGQVIGGLIGASLLTFLKASTVRALLIVILFGSSLKLVIRGIETLTGIEIPLL